MPSFSGEGAVKGAAGGAAAGSVFGPWGAAIGGVGGGLLGGFMGGDKPAGMSPEQQQMYDAYIRSLPGRSVTSDFRADQRELVDALEAQSAGRGPSLATQQLNMAYDQANRQQQSIANAARGSGAGLAQFQAGNQSMQLQARAAQESAAARMAEQTAARNQLGLTLQGARGQDIESQLRLMGLNDQAIAQYMGTAQQTPGQVGMGTQILAGGTSMMGTMAGSGNVQQAPSNIASPYGAVPGDRPFYSQTGAQVPAASPYTPVGNGTLNPYAPAAPGTRQKSMVGGREGTVVSGTGGVQRYMASLTPERRLELARRADEIGEAKWLSQQPYYGQGRPVAPTDPYGRPTTENRRTY